jgi:hydroxymethylbilane synthase
MTGGRVRIGTRGSELALWQAHHVEAELRRVHPELQIELVIVKTRGDEIQDRALHEVGGKGLFVKAIEDRLLAGDVDLAVHSMKDMPALSPAALVVAATPPREDARDALVAAPGRTLASLPAGTRLGTGSLRRGALARRIAPQVEVVPLRGNVPTRMGKLDRGDLDAVLLAAAGLRRLGLAERIVEPMDPDAFCPAPTQGILALQCRDDDVRTRELVEVLEDGETRTCATAERAVLVRLQAGCTVPVGAYAVLERGRVRLRGLVIDPSGRPYFSAVEQGDASDAAAVGESVADALLAAGAGVVLSR